MAYPFIPSQHITAVSGRKIELIVIHTMEMAEKGNTAELCARWFQNPAAKVSAHYCVDNNSIVQCVRDQNVAWCAPGANHNGIHIEHAGRAAQDFSGWDDQYSVEMLGRSAQLVAALCKKHKIPVKFKSAAGLKRGGSGVTTHAAVSAAFKRSNHTDPGKQFPMGLYLGLVRAYSSMLDSNAIDYFTYKKDVRVGPGEKVYFKSGRGYFAA